MEESDVAVAMGGSMVALERGFSCRQPRWWRVVVVEYMCSYALVTDVSVRLVINVRVSV